MNKVYIKQNIGVYKIVNPKGKVYIGSSINLKKRMNQYKNKQCKCQFKIFNSLNKYGFDNHYIEIVEFVEDVDILNCRERFWQEYYEVIEEGLNLSLVECGDRRRTFSKEALRSIGDRQRGGKNPSARKVINVLTKEIFDTVAEVTLKEGFSKSYLSGKLNNRSNNPTPYTYLSNYESYLKGENVNVLKDVQGVYKVKDVRTSIVYNDIHEAIKDTNYKEYRLRTLQYWLNKDKYVNKSPFVKV